MYREAEDVGLRIAIVCPEVVGRVWRREHAGDLQSLDTHALRRSIGYTQG